VTRENRLADIGKEIEQATEDVAKKQSSVMRALREKEKIEIHRKQWLEQQRTVEERAAENEMEEFLIGKKKGR